MVTKLYAGLTGARGAYGTVEWAVRAVDGNVIRSGQASSEAWARWDAGVAEVIPHVAPTGVDHLDRAPWPRREDSDAYRSYTERFPDGWTIEWVNLFAPSGPVTDACPCCGAVAKLHRREFRASSITGERFRVACPGCELSTPWRERAGEAVALWNRRPAEPAARARPTHIYCDVCGSHQPLVAEPLTRDDRNAHAWGDLVCGTCHVVIATVEYRAESRE